VPLQYGLGQRHAERFVPVPVNLVADVVQQDAGQHHGVRVVQIARAGFDHIQTHSGVMQQLRHLHGGRRDDLRVDGSMVIVTQLDHGDIIGQVPLRHHTRIAEQAFKEARRLRVGGDNLARGAVGDLRQRGVIPLSLDVKFVLAEHGNPNE